MEVLIHRIFFHLGNHHTEALVANFRIPTLYILPPSTEKCSLVFAKNFVINQALFFIKPLKKACRKDVKCLGFIHVYRLRIPKFTIETSEIVTVYVHTTRPWG